MEYGSGVLLVPPSQSGTESGHIWIALGSGLSLHIERWIRRHSGAERGLVKSDEGECSQEACLGRGDDRIVTDAGA